MSATFAVKKKCCCDADTTPQYYQGFDCKNGGAALPIYTRTTNSPGDLYYRLGGYCVQFDDTPIAEGDLPDDAIIIGGGDLDESFETCEECSPADCPTDNDLCLTTFLATIVFPSCGGEPFVDVAENVTPQGDGTWFWQSGDEVETITIFCEDGYWIGTYSNTVRCGGVTFRWHLPRASDCPGPTAANTHKNGPWEFLDETGVCCAPDNPTFVVSLP